MPGRDRYSPTASARNSGEWCFITIHAGLQSTQTVMIRVCQVSNIRGQVAFHSSGCFQPAGRADSGIGVNAESTADQILSVPSRTYSRATITTRYWQMIINNCYAAAAHKTARSGW
ncbi:hypothetical protein GCM10018954_036690 [Kutzneria kofuensis]